MIYWLVITFNFYYFLLYWMQHSPLNTQRLKYHSLRLLFLVKDVLKIFQNLDNFYVFTFYNFTRSFADCCGYEETIASSLRFITSTSQGIKDTLLFVPLLPRPLLSSSSHMTSGVAFRLLPELPTICTISSNVNWVLPLPLTTHSCFTNIFVILSSLILSACPSHLRIYDDV